MVMEIDPRAPHVALAAPAVVLSFPVQAIRALSIVVNAVLLTLPVFYLFSGRRPDLTFFIISACCIVIAIISTLPLVSYFAHRPLAWGAALINVLVILLFAFLFISMFLESGAAAIRNSWTTFILSVPALLNLFAIMLVGRARARATYANAA
jgi:hypothetical protein